MHVIRLYVTDSRSSNRSGQSQQKTFYKEFIPVCALIGSCVSWEEIKMSTLRGVWRKLSPTFMEHLRDLRLQQRKSCTQGTNSKRVRVDMAE
jgi:hypothetical protein